MALFNTSIGSSGSTMPSDPSVNKAPEANYSILNREANWFKSLPYGFKATIGRKTSIFYLPINPGNITITTHYATNMITTLYDTIEEHSEVRYFDINISGTTGFMPQYSSVITNDSEIATPKEGRTAYQSGEVFSNLAGGFFKQTLGKLDAALNSAKDTLNAIGGKSNKFQPGVSNQQSGYVAFHNLYKFFLDYKDSVVKGTSSGVSASFADIGKQMSVEKPKFTADFAASLLTSSALATNVQVQTPLLFLNYKDNNQYSVVIQNFVLERSAENPMLYNYRIAMRGYNLSTIGKVGDNSYLTNRLAALGLGEDKPSLAARFKNGVKGGRATLNNLKGALGSAGR